MSLYKKSTKSTAHNNCLKDKIGQYDTDYTKWNGNFHTDTGRFNHHVKHHYGSAKDLTQNYRRSMEPKNDCVNDFTIKLDTACGHQYQPGNEVTGSLRLDMAKPMEICHVEFSVIGYGMVKSKNPLKNTTVRRKELYLNKTIRMFKNHESDVEMSVIEPGVYASRFKFRLPQNLASSMSYMDPRGTFVFEISYSLQAAIMTILTDSRYENGLYQVKTQPLIHRKVVFFVMRDFDINLIPNAMWPNKIGDELVVGCRVCRRARFEATAIVERGVYVCGDIIRVSVEIEPKNCKNVYSINTELKQTIQIRGSKEPVYALINVVKEKHIAWKKSSKGSNLTATYQIDIPTPSDMLPSDIPGTKLISISYKIHITIYLAQNNQKLLLELPVLFGPADMIRFPWQRGSGGFPVFNRPTRFPNFAKSSNPSCESSLRSNATYKSIAEYNNTMPLQHSVTLYDLTKTNDYVNMGTI